MINFTEKQQEAINLLLEKKKVFWALGMSVGKTAAALECFKILREKNEVKRMIVVAPLATAKSTWVSEPNKFSAYRHFSLNVFHGSKKKYDESIDITVLNYSGVAALLENKIEKQDTFFVLDESTAFKNIESRIFIQISKLTFNANYIVCMSGTPTSKGLKDLYAQYFILDGGERLGHYEIFLKKYFEMKSAGYYVRYTALKGSVEPINKLIEDITIRGNIDLPIKLKIIDIDVDANEKQLDSMSRCEMPIKMQTILAGFFKDPYDQIIDLGTNKHNVLKKIFEKYKGKNFIIAYNFIYEKKMLLDFFINNYGVRVPFLGGDSDKSKLKETIDLWNDGKIRFLLVNPASVSHGVNMQFGGHILIWHTLTFSYEKYEQLNARLFRRGQENDVLIYRLITKDSIEGAIAGTLSKSKSISDNFFLKKLDEQRQINMIKKTLKPRGMAESEQIFRSILRQLEKKDSKTHERLQEHFKVYYFPNSGYEDFLSKLAKNKVALLYAKMKNFDEKPL